MLKKIMCIISTLIILISISIVPASAEDTTAVNEWFVYDWGEYLSDIDFSSYVFPDKYDYDTSGIIFFHTRAKHITSFFYDNLPYDIYPYEYTDSSSNDFRYFRIAFPNGQWKTYMDATLTEEMPSFINSVANTELINNQDDLIIIVSDIEKYNYLSSLAGFKGKVYFNEKPVQSFVDYCNGVSLELNKVVAPEGFTKSGIKYSYSFDNPFNNYGIKPYESELENYVTAGLFSDLNVYYNSEFVNGSEHEHAEDISFYVDMTDDGKDGALLPDYNNYFDKTLYDYYHDGGKLPEESLSAFMNAHFKAVHFEKDSYSLLDYFNPGLGENKYSSLSDFITVDMINGKFYLKFTMNSEYTLVGSIFNGIRVIHTCSFINSSTGDIGGSGNGLGSDESEADDSLSRPPTKEELKDFGFNYGYPNTQGSYPYKLTVFRNGKEYFQIYFSKMPSVTSTYYSDKCIDYGVNVMNTKVYMYFKEQHMSKVFDFTNNNEDIYNNDMVQAGGAYDNLVFKPLDEATGHLLNSLLNVNVSEFNNTYTLHFWTNYTGTFENMNGFYCKFNWDLQSSGHFQKNNSDDDYDYTTDYVPDESFTDNNGNIHGGAVEPPTDEPIYNGFNNSDFSFDENSLWNYADSFLAFCAKAFKVLPAFIWQLIACSIVVVIILRVVGR